MSEGACFLAMQQQRLSIEIMLQSERGSVSQAEVWVLDQLRTKQASKIEHLADLGPGLDRARPFNAHVVNGLTRADTQGVDQVAGYQDTCGAEKHGRPCSRVSHKHTHAHCAH